jgi:hypothetical protein
LASDQRGAIDYPDADILKPAIPQSCDTPNANRRDYILPNYSLDGEFWQFMRVHYDAHYVVAEVKNLSRPPGKAEILQVANYLNPHGTGLFALTPFELLMLVAPSAIAAATEASTVPRPKAGGVPSFSTPSG